MNKTPNNYESTVTLYYSKDFAKFEEPNSKPANKKVKKVEPLNINFLYESNLNRPSILFEQNIYESATITINYKQAYAYTLVIKK